MRSPAFAVLSAALASLLAALAACASAHDASPNAATPSASNPASASAPTAAPTTATSAAPSAPPATDGGELAWVNEPALIAEGRAEFAQNCAACHRADAGGLIGPNLTDAAWLHGGTPAAIYATVRHGHPDRGMPSWGSILGDRQVRAVVAYVVSVRDTNVAGGKAPQGPR